MNSSFTLFWMIAVQEYTNKNIEYDFCRQLEKLCKVQTSFRKLALNYVGNGKSFAI